MRPLDHIKQVSRRYPTAWKQIDSFRQQRGKHGFPDWPDWCFCPMAGSYAVVSGRQPVSPGTSVADIARVAALSAWRVTQSVYRFDAELYNSLITTNINKIPVDLLYRLPEWCVYIESNLTTSDDIEKGFVQHGFFAHLECDANEGRTELRLLLDADQDNEPLLIPVILHINHTTIEAALQAAFLEASKLAQLDLHLDTKQIAKELAPMISLLLYLCSESPDYGDRQPPEKPLPVKTKKGRRLFPPNQPTTWDVGVRIGATIRNTSPQSHTTETAARGTKRPHVRRAHWHLYWTGKKGNQSPKINWIPPTTINMAGHDKKPVVIKPIK